LDTDLEIVFPEYRFNWYPSFKAKTCKIDGCGNKAYNMLLGVKIPDSVGYLEAFPQNKITKEIFMEAKTILDNGPALERLTSYLYFKTRVFTYGSGDFVAVKLLKQYSKIILNGLNIDKEASLSDQDKHKILIELGMYPDRDKK
jgi:hypothetical protein